MNAKRGLLTVGVLCVATALLAIFLVLQDPDTRAHDLAKNRPSGDSTPAPTVQPSPPSSSPSHENALPEPPHSANGTGSSETEETRSAGNLIRGTARAPTGTLVEPYEVTLRLGETTSAPSRSDGQGRFTLRFQDLLPGEQAQATLIFRACGFETLVHELSVRGGDYSALEVTLQPTTDALSGRVLNPSGEPIPNVRVLARNNTASATLEIMSTDTDGRFTTRCTRNADVISMRFQHPLFIDRSMLAAEVNGDWNHVTVTLDKGCVLEGTVLDAFGRPASGILVRAALDRPSSHETAEFQSKGTSDSNGIFRLTGLSPGPIELGFWSAKAKPGSRALMTNFLVMTEEEPTTETFSLPASPD